MNVNLAERAHNHNWKLDPIVRSLLDTDFYKLLMLQFIWKNFPEGARHLGDDQPHDVRCAWRNIFRPAALIEQMEHVRQLRFRKSEMIWLAGNTFYGTRSIFEPAFLDWLEMASGSPTTRSSNTTVRSFCVSDGLWTEVTMWEVYGLALMSEMKTRAALSRLSELELDVLYARAKTRLWDKIEKLRSFPEVRISEFGTRRRHSFLWQEYVVMAMRAGLRREPLRHLEYLPRLQARSRGDGHERA